MSLVKQKVYRSEAWRRAVASLPCVLCGAAVPYDDSGQVLSQHSHRNFGKGGALKTPDYFGAALCPACHSAIDSGRDMEREERRAQMDHAILLTFEQLILRQMLVLTTTNERLLLSATTKRRR